MKVVNNKEPKSNRFSDILIGQVFRNDNSLYIKFEERFLSTRNTSQVSHAKNCLNLESGALFWFNEDIEVETVNAYIVLDE